MISKIAAMISRRLDEWLIKMHAPSWHPEYGSGPVRCELDHKLWPCKDYLDALERTSVN